MMRSTAPIKDFAIGIYDGPHATPRPSNDGPIFLGIKNVTVDGRLDFENIRHVSEMEFPRWTRRVKPQKNDIVFSYEATLHRYARIPEGFEGCLGRRMALVRPDCKKVVPRFLHYYFLSPVWRAKMDAISRLPARQSAAFRLRAFQIPKSRFRQLNVQVAIANILATYDDLIENNRRRIALLEEAARLLYREWFIHFRFPGHEQIAIVEGIPEGWKWRMLVELAEVVMGQSPKSRFYNDAGDGLPFHQGVSDYGFRFVSHRTYSSVVTKIAEVGDILISVRAPVGRINITRDRIILGRGLAAIRSRTGHQSFLLYAMKNHFYAENIIGTGAIYAATNKKELGGQRYSLNLRRCCCGNLTIRPMRSIYRLVASRAKMTISPKPATLLLPRLMNGEIAV